MGHVLYTSSANTAYHVYNAVITMGIRLKAKSLQDKNLTIKVQIQILRSVSKGIKKTLDAKKTLFLLVILFHK